MSPLLKSALLGTLCLAVGTALAAGLKITEEYDDFTKETYLQSGDLKLCQVKSAGFAASCAQLRLVWRQSSPDLIAIQVEQPDYSDMTAFAVNIGGTISLYGAKSPVTDFDYDEALGRLAPLLGRSSSNVFVVPVSVLKSITESKDNGVVRVSGINASTDYDFYRKAKAGKRRPADELREFVTRVESY